MAVHVYEHVDSFVKQVCIHLLYALMDGQVYIRCSVHAKVFYTLDCMYIVM